MDLGKRPANNRRNDDGLRLLYSWKVALEGRRNTSCPNVFPFDLQRFLA
jgi:hypothetical protein